MVEKAGTGALAILSAIKGGMVESDPPPPVNTQASLAKARAKILSGVSESAHQIMGIPPRYKGKSLIQSPHSSRAQEAIRQGHSIFITGACGSGKTHLGIALMQEWFAAGLRINEHGEFRQSRGSARFLPVLELMLEIKSAWDGGSVTETRIIDRYSRTPFLMLDDLGAEKPSEGARQVLLGILDRRHREMLPTIITSNLSLDRVAEHVDDRVASRLCEDAAIIDLGNHDHRLEMAKK